MGETTVPADIEILEYGDVNEAHDATKNDGWDQISAIREDTLDEVFNEDGSYHHKETKKYNEIRLIKFNGQDGITYWLQGKDKIFPDADSTEIIYVDDQPFEVTPEKRKAFQFHDQEMKMGWLKASFHLAITLDTELYKVGGYNTKEEYAKYHLGETPRNMQRKAKNGRRILSMLPDATSMSHLASGDYDGLLGNVAEIGPTKLNEIIKFDEDDFDLKQLAETGEATLPSGDTISIDEIKTQTVKEVAQDMKKERNKLQKRIANLEEDKKKAREERDHYRADKEALEDTLEANEAYIQRAHELENMYGQADNNVKEAYTAIDKTKQMLREVESVFGPVDTLNWDAVPDTLMEEVKNVLHIIHRMQISAMDRFPFLHDIEDLEEFPAWKVKGGELEGDEVEVQAEVEGEG